jgi:hypothetical protein
MYKTEETAGEVGQGCVQFMSLCINIKEIHFLWKDVKLSSVFKLTEKFIGENYHINIQRDN